MTSPAAYRVIFPPPPPKQLPASPQSRADIQHVEKYGYVVLRNCFSSAEAEAAKAEIERLSTKDGRTMMGRNVFEGVNTTRIYSLLNKTRKFDQFVLMERVLALNDWFLDPGYNITAFHTIQINPREKAQELYHDDGYCNIPRPRPPLGTAIIIALDDFTAQNGSTNIVPGSHRWPPGRLPDRSEAVPTVCPAGSVIYFLGTTWHGGGKNESQLPRKSLTVQYCQPYIRPIENQILAVDPRKLAEIPERIVTMMGYNTHRPFIGYVDGMNPRKGIARMMQWAQSPVDHNPPTFATKWESKL